VTSEEGVGALYKGLLPNVLRGMAMNVGMLACYDQAKEVTAKILNDPMTNGPALPTKLGSAAIAVRSLCGVLLLRSTKLMASLFVGFYGCPLFIAI